MNILIIEDNNDLLCIYKEAVTDYLKKSVKDITFRIYTARDYGEYLKVLEQAQDFDLVISDWILVEQTSSYDILVNILDNNRVKNKKNLNIITGYTTEQKLNTLISQNKLKPIIKKPIDMSVIKNITQEFLDNGI